MSDAFSSQRAALEAADPVAVARKKRLQGTASFLGEEHKLFLDQATQLLDFDDKAAPLSSVTQEIVARYLRAAKRTEGRDITRNEIRLLELWSKNAIALSPLLGSSLGGEFSWLANKALVSELRKKAGEGKENGSGGTDSST